MNTRSNRRLTEFACELLDFFLLRRFRGSGSRSSGTTLVTYRITRDVQIFRVDIFDEPILRVVCDDWKPCAVWVGFTSFYDGNGGPSRTTRERLNGLLDRLAMHRVIPPGVRVFKDGDSDPDAPSFRIGLGENSVPVGEGVASCVYITPNPDELQITGSALEVDLGGLEVVL